MKNCWIIMAVIGLTIVSLTAFAVAPVQQPIVPKEKIALFNGKDFTGWKLFVPDQNHDVTKTWSVVDGMIRCEGKPNGYMRTEKDYSDYLLHVEWRWPEKGGNSGVLIHNSGDDVVWPKSLECQLASGNAGDFWAIGGVEFKEHAKGGQRVSGRRTIKLKDSSEKPVGQWNAYDIICKDDWVVVLVNGVLQNVATKCSEKSGRICLQSEGAPIEFRNIYIEPLNTDGR
jgi:hypothetical protein